MHTPETERETRAPGFDRLISQVVVAMATASACIVEKGQNEGRHG
jgi:hypothetical protein